MSRTVDIKIKTTADTQAADKSVKSLDNLDKQQSKVNKTANASKQAGINASAGFGAAGAAAGAAANGGISGISSAMGQMLQQMEGVAAFAGTGGLLLGAFAAWKAAVDAIREAHKQLQDNIDSITIGNLQAKNKKLTESYKEITDQLNAASAAITRFHTEKEAGSSADKRYDMTMVDLEDAQKRAALDPTDTFGAQRLTVETAKRKAYIEKEYERHRLEAQKQEIGQQRSVTQTKYEEEQTNYREIEQSITSVSRAIGDIQRRAQADASKKILTSSINKVWEEAEVKMKDLGKELETLKTQFANATKSLEESEADLRSLSAAASINYRESETSKVAYDISRTTSSTTAAGITYAQRQKLLADRASAQSQIESTTEQQSRLRDRVRKEFKEHYNATRDGSSPEKIDKELADWHDATAALNKFMSKAAPLMKEMKETADRATQALNNLP